MESYTKLKKLSAKNNEVEFAAEIPPITVREYEHEEIAHMGRSFSLPGFRKGKVPEAMLRTYADPVQIFQNAAESAVRAAIVEIAKAESVEAIGLPEVRVTSIEPEKPVEFTVRFAIDPPIELPDYKKIASEIVARKDDDSVSEKEIDDAVHELQHVVARAQMMPQKEGEEMKEPSHADLPELNDAFAEKLGGSVKTLHGLREEIKRELGAGKKARQKDAKRDEIIQAIVNKTKLTVPPLLIEHELAHLLENNSASEKKPTDKERADVEARIRTSLIFQKIREAEGITASSREIADEINILKRRYPKSDPEALKRTAEASIVQEKIFALFEG